MKQLEYAENECIRRLCNNSKILKKNLSWVENNNYS